MFDVKIDCQLHASILSVIESGGPPSPPVAVFLPSNYSILVILNYNYILEIGNIVVLAVPTENQVQKCKIKKFQFKFEFILSAPAISSISISDLEPSTRPMFLPRVVLFQLPVSIPLNRKTYTYCGSVQQQ